ncbi:MAG: hypothetical protein PHO67_07780 [Candidatus Omnitrophica bacterium]|nr:hypothetical protein [Candidatus Omnitrophota bacterium]
MEKNDWKQAEAKKRVDSMIGLPNVKLRKGVARSGGALTGWVDYNYKILRDADRRWTMYVEWVDMEGEGFRIILPHELVEAVRRATDSIMKQALRDRAQAAATTRANKQKEE